MIRVLTHSPTTLDKHKTYRPSLSVFPRRERRPASVKNEVVSLLLNMPGSNDEGLHEEGILVLLF
jgi:hypothetical protein